MSADAPGARDPRQLIAEIITGEDTSRERIPALLGLLDVGDRQVRLGAATALCLVADAHPDAVSVVVRRLADRVDADSPATELALSYLAVSYPDAVSTVLDSLDSEAGERVRRRTERGRGNALLDRSPLSNRDIGRTTLPGQGDGYGPRQVYTDDEETDGDRAEDAGGEGDDRLGGTPLVADADWLPIVEHESPFDGLSILAPRDSRRYGDSYRTLGTRDDEEYALGLRLLHGPGSEEEFLADLRPRLDDWASASDIEHVLTLYGWHTEPGPWIATEYTAETLADRDAFDPADAVWHATRLARTVTALHEQGIVHGGIDPENVAYYGNVLTEDERQAPLLDNVGLLHIYRYHFDPASYLDPRYAAPEYYDRRFGRIDHATDIYQLGAVCFRLFTGRAPVTGSFDTVRERVVAGEGPAPSDVAAVPPAVDDVVGKAMARQKLARYETVSQLTQELRALGDPVTDSGE
ncbi:hypothetical protein ACFQL1_18120 [Halomicroarcula sp. GCM10025709]|uniref:hypothetical protein n=1 Tax=Haloarcula TaxID=2237 RepID=UPI0024C44BCB|nr:hypothetical protein [Halomicroarcula sp. YJ-61-S]